MTQRNKRRSAEKPTAVKFDRSDSGMAGGVLILGGIVAVGAVAGAIAARRRKTSNKTDDEYGKRGDGNSKRTPRENGNGGGLRSLLQIHGKQFSPVQSPDDDAPHEGEEPSPETIAGKEINGEDPAIIFDFPRFSDDLVTHISCNLHDGKYFPSDSRLMETDSNREISDSSPTSIGSTYQKKTEIPGQNSGKTERAGFIMEMKSYLKEEGVWQWNLATIVWAWVLVAAVVLAISLLKRRNTGYGISV